MLQLKTRSCSFTLVNSENPKHSSLPETKRQEETSRKSWKSETPNSSFDFPPGLMVMDVMDVCCLLDSVPWFRPDLHYLKSWLNLYSAINNRRYEQREGLLTGEQPCEHRAALWGRQSPHKEQREREREVLDRKRAAGGNNRGREKTEREKGWYMKGGRLSPGEEVHVRNGAAASV